MLVRRPYFVFVSLEMSLFSSVLYHYRFLSVWQIRCTFLLVGGICFYLVTTAWIFGISLLCKNSTNQSINQRSVSLHAAITSTTACSVQ